MLRDLKHRFVDGLILVLAAPDRRARRRARARGGAGDRDRPPPKGTRVDTVRAYSRKGAAEAVRHLHAAGRRRIAFVNGPQQTVPGSVAPPRLPRRPALVRARSATTSCCVVADDFMIEPGRRAVERLLARARPDAIFCANDLLAVGALAALRDAAARRPAATSRWWAWTTRPRGGHLADADHGRPRLGRAGADRGRAAASADRGPVASRAVDQRRAAPRRPRVLRERRRERRPRASAGRSGAAAAARASASPDRESMLLLIPALLPVVILSVLPLVRGIYLGFTDSRAGFERRRRTSSGSTTSARCSTTTSSSTRSRSASSGRSSVTAIQFVLRARARAAAEPAAARPLARSLARARAVGDAGGDRRDHVEAHLPAAGRAS